MQDISVVIPSNRTANDILPLLLSLQKQTVLPQRVIIVYDTYLDISSLSAYKKALSVSLSQEFYDCLLVVNNVDFSDFFPQQWASYVRNRWITHVETSFVACIDDDNICPSTFFEDFLVCYDQNSIAKILVPTELYRDTSNIRSQWYDRFNVFLARPRKVSLISHNTTSLIPISFASSNCLFGETKVFRDIPFDNGLPFVYEDFYMTKRVSISNIYGVYVCPSVSISHMMRQKTKIQDVYVHTPFHAFQKWRNRVIFVKNTCKPREILVFYLCG